jgi:predicted dehydrogenase
LTAEQKERGRANFHTAVASHIDRRDFMKGMLAAGAVLPISAAAYFGYQQLGGHPVKTGLIGAGDEGGVLVGEHSPEYLKFVAYSDIRPFNQRRIFKGESSGPRKGFNAKYGSNAEKDIKLHVNYKDLLANKDIEAVVIALPLHLHAPVAIEALKAGKHVLCEKLMAWNITQCKEMIKAAEENDRILSIGHQRHYSLLYAQALELLNTGDLGDIRHIRALWHRNNAIPRLDKDGKVELDAKGQIVYRDGWKPPIPPEDREALEARIKDVGYKSMDELCRWRLFNRTGAGLMAELGSHQLDACSIFLGKVHPIAVSGIGGKYFYKDERECDDHVYVNFEFPGKNYATDKNDIVVMSYSSINTNGFEKYGECVMGSRGTMVVDMEQQVLLYPESGVASRTSAWTVTTGGAGKPAVQASGSMAPGAALAAATKSLDTPVSRGYREEMEDFAYCIRMWNQGSKADRRLPRCHGKVAMADAIVALTSNLAMKSKQRIEFKSEWFDPKTTAVPDAEHKPEVV